jgi:putative ABC transport system permease protein
VRVLTASVLILLVVLVTRVRGLDITNELVTSSVRAFIQLLLLASVLAVIFSLESILWVFVVLAGMMTFASYTSSKRAQGIRDPFRVCALSIVISSSTIITLMIGLGVLPLKMEYIITLGAMVVGNTMNIVSLAIDRLKGEVRNNVLRIESALALGATSTIAVAPMVRTSVRASLIPTVDNMKTLGLVWIPGLMAGMIIGGVDPSEAAAFQLVIILMILASNTLSSMIATKLSTESMFSAAEQLTFGRD